MYLVVADVPADVAVYINGRAGAESRSVDAVVCEMLMKAKNGTGETRPVQPQPAAVRAVASERRVYGVTYKGGRMTIESAALLKETAKTYIVERRMDSYYQLRHIPKTHHDGRPRAVAFSPSQAAEQCLAYWQEALRETRGRQPTSYYTIEQIATNIAHQERRVREAEALLASAAAG